MTITNGMLLKALYMNSSILRTYEKLKRNTPSQDQGKKKMDKETSFESHHRHPIPLRVLQSVSAL
jgi:hypothetical protein